MDAITQPASDDWRLFRAKGDAAAFGRLVKSLTDLVHSAAWRVTQEGSLAEDVTQAVFLLLAKKGRSLPAEVQPGPWCWRQAMRLASNAVRTESRRRNREQLYAVMNEPSDAEETWRALSPLLDEALAALPAADQAVIVGRYFERQDLAAVARHLGISAAAAKKRTSRAVERLRTLLRRRGVGMTAAVLGYSLKAETVRAAPAALAAKCAKAAVPSIPVGTWPVLLSRMSTRAAMAGLAAGLVVAGFCGWQLEAVSREAEQRNADFTAALSAVSAPKPGATADAAAPPELPRLAFAEILRRLAATHWEPDNLATQKRIAWLMGQIDPARLPETARWALERRHFRERQSLLGALWSSWLERAPETCADFWTDEIYALSDGGSFYLPWFTVQVSLSTAMDRGFDTARLDAWFQRRITVDPGLLHTPGWKAVAQMVLGRRLAEDPAAGPALLTSLPPGPGRRWFLRTTNYGPIPAGSRRTVLDVLQAIPDETLRNDAVRAYLPEQRADYDRWGRRTDYDQWLLDWWLQLPQEERRLYLEKLLSTYLVRDNAGAVNHAKLEEVLRQMPEEMRAPLLIGKFTARNGGTPGLERDLDSVSLAPPAAREFRAVHGAGGFPEKLAAAAAVTDPQLQARLLRGVYGQWHARKPAQAAAFLEQCGWPAETLTMLRDATKPLTP